MRSWALDTALSVAGWLARPPLPLLDWEEAGGGEQKPLKVVVVMVLRDSFRGLAGTP